MRTLGRFSSLTLLIMATLMWPVQRTWSGRLPQNVAVSQEDAQALSTLSEYMLGRVDLARTLLQKHGYQPAVSDQTWRQFPSVRKLETAYSAAEAAAPNRGGEKLLALLASDLAQQYEAVRHESSLAPYLHKADEITSPVIFGRVPTQIAIPHLPLSVVAAIDTISQYCSRGPAGTPQSILRNNFGLSEETAYQVLRESSSNAEAFKRAMTFVPEQERIPKLKSLVSQLTPKFEAIAYEPTLQPFLPSAPASPESFQLSPPTGRPSVPPREAGMPSAAEAYPTFVQENYTTEESMSFSVMSEVVEGFGGVVFGNRVSADVGLPKIDSISFDVTPGQNVGLITYHFADSSTVSLPTVSLEDAYAAYHMVYAGLGGVGPQNPGKGTGLVSLYGTVPTFTCDKKTLKVVDDGTNFDIVLHPALANTELGWAAVMVDSLPIEPKLIDAMGRQSGLADDEIVAVQNLFFSMHTSSFVDNWKVVDVPLTVASESNVLVVSRSGTDPSIARGLRRTAFIEMRPMLEKGFDSEFSRNFYQYVPILTKASVDYARLNRFAAVLAVVRLAKIEGANFLSPPSLPKRVSTPDAIQITDSAITPIPPFVRGNALEAVLTKSQQCIQDIAASSPTLLQSLSEIESLETQHDKAVMDAYRASPESDEERTASRRAQQLDVQLDLKMHQFDRSPEGEYVLELFAIMDHVKERLAIEQEAVSESSSPSGATRHRHASQPQ